MVLNNILGNVLGGPGGDPLGILLPSQLAGLKLWARLNQGITVSGAGVSQWDDQSGQGNHLKQGTDTNRPALQGDGSILFDGVDNFLKADAFTLAQPETFYVLYKTITDTAGYIITDGNANDSALIYEETHPNIRQYAGAVTGVTATGPATGTYFVATAVFNGASSSVTVNDGAPSVGNAGATGAGGLTLGSNAAGSAGFANIQVKEVIVFSEAHD
jgi:hypothetical protein